MRKRVLVGSLFVVGTLLVGCSSEPSPKSVVQSFVSAVKTGDLASAQQYEGNPDKSATAPDEATKDILKHDKFQIGTVTVNGNNATADVTITAPDMTQIARQMIGNALANAFTGNSVDSSNDAMSKELEQALNSKSLQMTTSDVKLDLVKADSGWKVISDNKEFMSAAIGHLDKLEAAVNGK